MEEKAKENKPESRHDTKVVLKDGSSVLLRPIDTDDAKECMDFVSGLSPRAEYLRFHNAPEDMELDAAVRFCNVDQHDRFVLVAESDGPDHKIVGIGRYYRLPDRRSADVALAIEDDYRDRGLGTGLLESLAGVARQNGISTFRADVLAGNESIMTAFKDYGFHVSSKLQAGVHHLVIPITRTPVMEAEEAEKERASTLASLRSLVEPQSVAVIGASRHPGTIGYLLLECLINSGFSGKIYPVNPNVDSLMSLKVYPSVTDIPGDIDMALIAVPARLVCRVADECGKKGVHSLVVISDGFKETGPEGAAREKELLDVAFGHGMRVVGPNCMGVINTDPSVKMNATFSPVYPPRGNVAFLSQSGAMGLVVLEYASNLNMGISTFISVGNRADISSNDLLEYWEQDPATDVILLYLESFGNPRKFSRIARRVTAKKPVIAVKGGSTQAGSRAASSHTGAMATSDVVSDVLFQHAGIIRVNLMEEMFDVATLLSDQPLPRGRRLYIVTNGGGPGIIAADASARQGLTLPQPSDSTIEKLKTALKRDIGVHNPLDTTAGADAEEFHGILRVLASDGDSDAVLAIFIPPVIADTTDFEKAISDVAPEYWKRGKPLLACFLGQRGFKANLGSEGRFVPSYPFPEEAISALARATEYAETRQKPAGSIPDFEGIEKEEAADIISRAMTASAERPLWLSADDVRALLRCYGINLVETVTARTPDEAAEAASQMGFPVAVKLASSTITHKTDVGGVVLDVYSPGGVKEAFKDIAERLEMAGQRKEMQGVVVQKMIKEGIETIAGVTQDPLFGPLIMFGSGGIYAELIKDVAMRLHPLTDLDAKEMICSIKMAKIFEGWRGSPPADVAAVQDMLLRLSAMVEDIPQIAELDFNPVKVMPEGRGYRIVDARVMLK